MTIEDMVAAATAEIAALEIEAAEYHEEIRRLKTMKNARTLKISALQQFIASCRPPNPKGMSHIGSIMRSVSAKIG
jgi:hypothetical protein